MLLQPGITVRTPWVVCCQEVVSLASTDDIKRLRDETGAGIMDCRRALEEAGGSIEQARDILRKRGEAMLIKKAGREANQGLIETYVHGGRIGAIVEVNCETDFVARTDDFKKLAREVAMQVASMSPKYISADEVPEAERDDPEATALLTQPYIRDNSKTIRDLLSEAAAKLGENIRIRRFTRYELGQ